MRLVAERKAYYETKRFSKAITCQTVDHFFPEILFAVLRRLDGDISRGKLLQARRD